MALSDFVRELMSDPDLQEAFAKDPDGVMAAAGLSDEEQRRIWSREREQISAPMEENHRPGGPPPPWPSSQLKIDSIAAQGPGGPPPPWPSSQLKIDSVDAASSEPRAVTLFITGHWFAPNIACKLLRDDRELDATVLSVMSGEQSRMIASVTLNSSTAAGAWDVKVINDKHVYDTFPAAFIA